jgi:hypothetical protein
MVIKSVGLLNRKITRLRVSTRSSVPRSPCSRPPDTGSALGMTAQILNLACNDPLSVARSSGSDWTASSYVQRRERAHRNENTSQHHSALALVFSVGCRSTIRGGGKPYSNMALICRLEEWARRSELPHGSSPWAEGHADAHDCIMVGIKRSYQC